MRSNRRYLVAVASLAVLAVVLGLAGTVAPAPEPVSPQQTSSSSSSDSTAHFAYPPTYDSGWENITRKAGQYLTLKHMLNTTDVAVDITGKQSLDPMGGAPAWNRTYGGTGNDYASSVVQTNDGGYALAGATNSSGAGLSDFWLVKTDSAGNMQWNQTYGGIGEDIGTSMVQTSDGGYALAGCTNSCGAGDMDFWLVKTDSTGNIQWNQTYGGSGQDGRDIMAPVVVVQTSDGGYALTGLTNSYGAGMHDFWLVKTDSAGNMQWNQTYGGIDDDAAMDMVQTSDGGYALAGPTHSYGAGMNDFWLVKTDSAGNMQWNQTYGGYNYDHPNSVVQTSDGGYALTGQTYSYGAGWGDFWLVKTDSTGAMLWNKVLGGGYHWDYPESVIQTSDKGYAVAGRTYSFSPDAKGDMWLFKTDSNGNTQWNKMYGGAKDDTAWSMVQTSDGGYALTGQTNSYGAGLSDFWLVKVKAEMNVEHQRNLGVESGLAWTGLTNNTITLYRGPTDPYWNYVRVRIWTIKEPTWIYGDINMDGTVDAEDLYIVGRNYGKSLSLLSLTGIIAIAGIHTVKKRRQT